MHNIHVHCTLYMIPVYDYQLHASVSVGPVSMNVRPPVYDEFSVFEVIKSRWPCAFIFQIFRHLDDGSAIRPK